MKYETFFEPGILYRSKSHLYLRTPGKPLYDTFNLQVNEIVMFLKAEYEESGLTINYFFLYKTTIIYSVYNLHDALWGKDKDVKIVNSLTFQFERIQ